MSLLDIIRQIELLNQQGIAEVGLGNFGESYKLHSEASKLARDTPGLNPDYFLVSEANKAYTLRKETNNPDIHKLLESVLREAGHMERTEEQQTHFGRGKVRQEQGILQLYQHPNIDVPLALESFTLAKEEYTAALNNTVQEIVPDSVIRNKLFAVIGQLGGLYNNLALSSDENKEEHIKLAVEHAEEELGLRQEQGETEGQGLMNAYHNTGFAYTTQVELGFGGYAFAKKHLEKALSMAEEDHLEASSSIATRQAWLEYLHDSENTTQIRDHMNLALRRGYTPASLDFFEPQLRELGEHLGGEIKDKVDKLYLERQE